MFTITHPPPAFTEVSRMDRVPEIQDGMWWGQGSDRGRNCGADGIGVPAGDFSAQPESEADIEKAQGGGGWAAEPRETLSSLTNPRHADHRCR